jgi:hypothetical protein
MIVNSITASTLLNSVMKNRFISSLLMFALWITALMSGSVLVIFLGLVVYLRPLLYIALLNRKTETQKPASTGFNYLQTFCQKATVSS